MSDNFYEILGLARDASSEEIKHAYRTLAREYHPDSQNPRASELLFKKVSEAYSTLSSAERREKYDNTLGINSAAGDIRKTRSYIFDDIEAEEESPKKGPTPKKTVRPQVTTPPMKDSGIVGKLTRFLKIKGDEEEVDENVSTYSDPEFMRGERIYKFNIDGLESLTGTTREIALKGDNNQPRMLKVRIPRGSCDGDLLRVKNDKEGEDYLIKLTVGSHEYVVREGRDIILRLPITIGEALTGTEVIVPTLTEPVPVSIPKNWDVKKRIRLKGRGVIRGDSAGDLYLELVLITPDRSIPQVEQVSTLIDEGYTFHPRAIFPKDFLKR